MSHLDAAKALLVLVVDDEALLRLDAAMFLENAGFKTLEAENAAEALKIIETRSDIDVLFTDIQMPGQIDGIELAVKMHARWPNVLLLITSGKAWPQSRELPDHGHFLAKPYRSESVLREIRALTREAETRRNHH